MGNVDLQTALGVLQTALGGCALWIAFTWRQQQDRTRTLELRGEIIADVIRLRKTLVGFPSGDERNRELVQRDEVLGSLEISFGRYTPFANPTEQAEIAKLTEWLEQCSRLKRGSSAEELRNLKASVEQSLAFWKQA